jgi:NAD+ kinase
VTDPGSPRRILLLTHTGRDEAMLVAQQVVDALRAHDLVVRLLADEAAEIGRERCPGVELVAGDSAEAANGCELAVVIGGDGTILRAAELTHAAGTPLLGVNLGHVGFLAEAESEDVESTIEAIVHRRYTAEERLTVDVSV